MTISLVAGQFVETYYQTLEAGSGARAGLAALYGRESMLTYEGALTRGGDDIAARLTKSTPAGVTHHATSIDAQPTPGKGILVTVLGSASIDGGNPVAFTETFNLAPTPDGGYFVHNHIVRVVAG
jgi:hypothetical protein